MNYSETDLHYFLTPILYILKGEISYFEHKINQNRKRKKSGL